VTSAESATPSRLGRGGLIIAWTVAIATGLFLLFTKAGVFVFGTVQREVALWLAVNTSLADQDASVASHATAAIIVACLPAIASLFWSHGRSAGIAWIVISAAFLILAPRLTADDVFFVDGRPARCFAMTPAGIVVARTIDWRCPQAEKKYGTPMELIAKDIVPSIDAARLKKPPRPIPLDDYDEFLMRAYSGDTAAIALWFAPSTSGGFNLYRDPGFDVETRRVLRPIDEPARAQILSWVAARAKTERDSAAVAVVRQQQTAIAEKRRRYLNPGLGPPRSDTTAAIAIFGDGKVNLAPIADALERSLREKGNDVVPLFRDAFDDDGLAKEIFQGSDVLIRELELSRFVHDVYVAHVVIEEQPAKVSDGLYIGRASVTVRRVAAKSGTIGRAGAFSEAVSGSDAAGTFDAAGEVLARTILEEGF
jgi:hypothetical protein